MLGRMFDGIEYRGFAQETVEILGQYAGVPVWNGLTDQWHPTQMLADILTMRDHSAKPLERGRPTATCGDARNNTANSLLVTGALLGMDVRIAAPEALLAVDDGPARSPTSWRRRSGARITSATTSTSAVEGADFLYTDVWVSMGEPASEWDERIEQLLPYQVNAELMKATGNPEVKFMHCLPALHNTETEVGRQIYDKWGLSRPRGDRRGLRVARLDRLRPGGEPAPHHQGGHGRHGRATEMRLVVAVGGNALLERGEVPLAEIQEKHVDVAVEALAPLAARPRPGDHPRQRAPGRPAGQRERRRSRPASSLPARRARRPDPGDDRLLPPAGIRERPARTAGGQPDLPDAGGGRRPGLRPTDQVRRAGLPGGRGPQAGRAPGLADPAGRRRLAAGGGLPRTPGDRGAPDDPHARRRRRHRDLRRGRRHPGVRRVTTAASTEPRRSSTRTSAPRCWPGTSTPTPW